MAARHRLSNIDPEARTADCSVCERTVGVNVIRRKGGKFSYGCQVQRTNYKREVKDFRDKPWKAHKGDRCEQCGFIPLHSVQLDVDHIDGDKKNNDPSNFRTLCANCHRLKTHLAGEYRGHKY